MLHTEKPDIISVVEHEGFEPIKKGGSYWILCPFHADSNPSLKINPEINRFYCFGCGAKGDSIDFVCKLRNLSFKECLEYLSVKGHSKCQQKQNSYTSLNTWRWTYMSMLWRMVDIIRQAMKCARTVDDVLNLAPFYHLLPIIEYRLELLEMNDMDVWLGVKKSVETSPFTG